VMLIIDLWCFGSLISIEYLGLLGLVKLLSFGDFR
jgi:hypothetical protein